MTLDIVKSFETLTPVRFICGSEKKKSKDDVVSVELLSLSSAVAVRYRLYFGMRHTYLLIFANRDE